MSEMENAKSKSVDAPRSSLIGEGERVDINLGHACNHRCIFCMQAESGVDQKKWVKLDELKSELDYYAKEKGVRSLGLLGGEPTLYPYIEQALDHAKSLGFNEITINTNGFRLGNWEFAKMVAQKGINRYCLSIHSEDPAVEDFLSGQKGAFVRKMRAIRNLIKIKSTGMAPVVISINAVLNKRNLPTIDRFVRFFRHLGITDIRFNYIRPEGGAENRKDIVCTYTEAIPKIMDLISLNEKELKVRLSFGEIPYCVYPESLFKNELLRRRYIGEYTDRRTFVSTFGNKTSNFSDEKGKQRFIWQDLKIDKLKTFVPACESCKWQKVCGGVWLNYLAMYGENEFRPLSE